MDVPEKPRVVVPVKLLTVKEYADVARQHPRSVYRRIWEGRQPGVFHVGGNIRLKPPETTT